MNERGLSESTQWAMVVPAALGLVLGLVQTGVWLHARSVASQAAAAAADLRAAGPDLTAQAEATAGDVAARGGLSDVVVETTQDSTTVTVTVTGSAPVFLDLGLGRITERVVLPLERVTAP